MIIPEISSENVRLTIALAKIRQAHTIGLAIPDSQILADAGYHTVAEYWSAALGDPMPASEFVYLLEGHLLDPQRTAEEAQGRISIKMLLWRVLREADANGEPWIIRPAEYTGDVSKARVRPREAVEWMHRSPRWRDHLPQSLAPLLESGAANLWENPGPKPGQPTQKDQMCRIALAILNDPSRRPRKHHGRKAELARLVHTEMKASSYQVDTIRKHIQNTVDDWEQHNPDD